jgi:hypothetical protein
MPTVPGNDDAVSHILDTLQRGINVVLEFGQHDRPVQYMLVANILTRRLHDIYREMTEKAMGDNNQRKPQPLVITIEEAHKFLSPHLAGQTIFGTIAREMRKYNVTLLIVDQRPSGIDDEVLSQVLRLTWEACLHIDWTRVAAWPAFLACKVGRARIEAARCDDWLSRRERVRRRCFQVELARREQLEHRSLTAGERTAVANAVAPSSPRVDWAKALLASRHPSTVAEVPDVVDGTTVEDQVEAHDLEAIRVRCLRDWLGIVAAQNEELAADLPRWSQQSELADRDLPARLARRVEPYKPLLLAMLGEAV